MLFQEDFFTIIIGWLTDNFYHIIVSIISVIFGYIIYVIIKRQIKRLKRKERFEEPTAKNLLNFSKYLITGIVLTAILIQFAESLGLISALFTLVGGTILGFAAMNTLGNMIAGFIIMISKPFTVGDRIIFNGRIADIVDIKLIYTVMVDLDSVRISVPNQKLLSEEVEDLGKKDIIRRHVTVTPGFDEDRQKVERILLEAARNVSGVLDDPEPYVWINSFLNYAVEYKLFVFIKDIKHLPLIESDLHKAVLDNCKENEIDISTPLLMRQINK